METQITFVITSRDGDILYRTKDGRQYVVKREERTASGAIFDARR
jgi:hypothetical protein